MHTYSSQGEASRGRPASEHGPLPLGRAICPEAGLSDPRRARQSRGGPLGQAFRAARRAFQSRLADQSVPRWAFRPRGGHISPEAGPSYPVIASQALSLGAPLEEPASVYGLGFRVQGLR